MHYNAPKIYTVGQQPVHGFLSCWKQRALCSECTLNHKP